jgi:hypothetical protein
VAILALLFAGAAGYLWYQNQNLKNAAVAAATTEAPVPALDTAGLQAQVATLTQDRDALTLKVGDLTNQLNDLSGQLSAFAVPQPGAPVEVPITVQGVIGGGGKSAYTVLTNKNILFTIKNSKDPKVVAILQPALTAPAIISGTHVIGSRDITVVTVNGTLIVAPPVATSTVTTTTSTTTTTTITTSGTLIPAASSTPTP